MAKLLIIEDDIHTNEAICEYMNAVGHTVFSAFDGESGIAMALETGADLIILDIMLPKMNGLEVLKALRSKSSIPILMLTGIDAEYIQAQSFDAEADDYMTKPFSMLLLEKRVTALLRRSQKVNETSAIKIGNVTIDFSGYKVWDSHGSIDMTPKEIDLLKFLSEHKGLVLTRSQILDGLWGYDCPVFERTIDTYVKNIRKKLHTDCIVTVKGVGYKYEERR